ncbi:hypothetical protein NMG60_11017475 [Bertholletia excelsa]
MRHVGVRGVGGRSIAAITSSSVLGIHALLTGNKAINTTTSDSASASNLRNLLLVAAVVKSLSENGGIRNLDPNSIPISDSLVVQVLRRGSLDVSKKLDFFRWCSLRPNYKHSPQAYAQILCSICRQKDHYDQVFDLLSSMRQDGLVLDSLTFKQLFDTFLRMGNFDSALKILDHIEHEQERNYVLNTDIYDSVLVALVRKEQLGLALSIFFKLLDTPRNGHDSGNCGIPGSVVCNELLVALRRADMKDEFRTVFSKLREKKQFALNIRGYNTCIHAFGCWGDLGVSLSLFREVKERNQTIEGSIGPDLCTYNSLIHILCLAGKVKDALIAWEELKGSGHEPDAFTYRIIIQGCCKSYRIEDAIKIFGEMQHNGFYPDTIVYNSLLDGLLKARRLTEACQLFEKMVENGVRASSWTYNILIDGLIKNGRAAAGYALFVI